MTYLGIPATVRKAPMTQQTDDTTATESTEVEDGRTAYTAYRDAVGGRAYDGQPIPGWDDLPDKVRTGWTAAGARVRASVLAPYLGDDAHKITAEQLGAFVSALGIRCELEDLLSITAAKGRVTVVRFRRNAEGQNYMLPGSDDPATITTTIAVVDGE
jgi:hypothetical protein